MGIISRKNEGNYKRRKNLMIKVGLFPLNEHFFLKLTPSSRKMCMWQLTAMTRLEAMTGA